MTVRIDRVVTSGTFSLDGQDFAVDNNVWIVGDEHEVVIVDAAHDAAAIIDAVAGRRVIAVVCTHAHNDHINAAGEVAASLGAPVRLHHDDLVLWDVLYPGVVPEPLVDGDRITVGDATLEVLHTPGHSPGGVCLWSSELDLLLSGDTLFRGGPGATGRSHSDFPTILRSIHDRLLSLPPQTRVLTGHGDETTIGVEAADYDAWVARGQ